MTYKPATVHQVAGSTVEIRELVGFPEFHIFIDGDKYEVFHGGPDDPGTDPDRWYTEVGGVIEGPYDTAEQLIDRVFLTEDGL